LFNLAKKYQVFYLFRPKFATESQQNSALSAKKGDFEPQYITLTTIKNLEI